MKSIISLGVVLLMVMPFIGCTSNNTPDLGSTGESKPVTSKEEKTGGVTNPFSKVEDSKIFNDEIGINIDAPKNATNIEYSLYSNEIAQINYCIDEKRFVLRASKTISGQELSGMHGNFEMTSYISCGDPVSVTVNTVELEDGSAFATSKVEMMDNDTVYLALSTTKEITGDEIANMIEEISYEMAEIQINSINDWGITLTTSNITNTGLTLSCKQQDGEYNGKLQTGSFYRLSRLENGNWVDLDYITDKEVAWTDEAYSILGNDTVEWKVDWEWLYGELIQGEYRISKIVMDFVETGNYEEETYYATFKIN